MGVTRIDDLGKKGKENPTIVPSGSAGHKQTLEATGRREAAKQGKPFDSERVITDPKTGKVTRRILVRGREVTIITPGEETRKFISEKSFLSAADVEREELGIFAVSKPEPKPVKQPEPKKEPLKFGQSPFDKKSVGIGLYGVESRQAIQRQRRLNQPISLFETPFERQDQPQSVGIGLYGAEQRQTVALQRFQTKSQPIMANAFEQREFTTNVNVMTGQETPSLSTEAKFKPEPSTITKSREPESFVDRLRMSSRKLEFKSQFETEPLKKIGTSGAAFGLGFASGITAPVRHPIKTFQGTLEFAFHPIKSSGTILSQLAVTPSGTLGELTGIASFPKAATLTTKGAIGLGKSGIKVGKKIGTTLRDIELQPIGKAGGLGEGGKFGNFMKKKKGGLQQIVQTVSPTEERVILVRMSDLETPTIQKLALKRLKQTKIRKVRQKKIKKEFIQSRIGSKRFRKGTTFSDKKLNRLIQERQAKLRKPFDFERQSQFPKTNKLKNLGTVAKVSRFGMLNRQPQRQVQIIEIKQVPTIETQISTRPTQSIFNKQGNILKNEQTIKQIQPQKQKISSIQKYVPESLTQTITKQVNIKPKRNLRTPRGGIPKTTKIKQIKTPPLIDIDRVKKVQFLKKKKKKFKKPLAKFQPSLIATSQNIKGFKPLRLTGFEVRPIEL